MAACVALGLSRGSITVPWRRLGRWHTLGEEGGGSVSRGMEIEGGERGSKEERKERKRKRG